MYGIIQVINYIRQMIKTNHCIQCGLGFNCREDLNEHMITNSHYKMNENEHLWKNSIYLKPEDPDDPLLTHFYSDESESENDLD